jgi:hypothetical protein
MSWVPPDSPPVAPPAAPPHDRPPFPAAGSGVGDDGNDGAERSRRRPGVVVAAVVVAVALVAGGAWALVLAGRVGGGADVRPRASGGVPVDTDELGAVVEELSAFVEEARGLRFLDPVEVEVLDGGPFQDRLLDDAVEDRQELEETAVVLRALGFLDADDDLSAVLEAFLGDAVVGFYDPEDGALVVRGAELSPYVRYTLVHELVHALDDQHFELHRPELDERDDEASAAFVALVEGSAVRVEQEWLASLDAGTRQQVRLEEARLGAGIDLADVPVVVPQLLAFPYVHGPDFVDALVDDGGQERLDAAFAEPPTTTAEILDPSRYLGGVATVEVAAPPADGEVVQDGVVGEWTLRLLLADVLPAGRVEGVTSGWLGDRFVSWRDGERSCVRMAFATLTRAEGAVLADALEAWAADRGDASVARGERTELTACAG